MKTFPYLRGLLLTAMPLVTLAISPGQLAAAPGGGAMSSGGGSAAVGASGGGHGGGGSLGGGHGGGSIGGGHFGGGISPGQHLGGSSFGSAHLVSPGFAGGQRFSNPGFGNSVGNAGLVRPNFNTLSHPNFGNGQVSNTGMVANRNGMPSISRRFDGNSTATTSAYTQRARPYVAARVNNAWTDSRTSGFAAPAARADRYGYNHAYDPGQSYLQHEATPGQHLYPNAPGYTPGSGNYRYSRSGLRGDRRGYHDRSYRSHDYYGGWYYPYLFSGFFPGYYGYGYGGDLGYAPGFDSGYSASVTNDRIGTGYAGNANSYNYYDQQGVAQDASNAPDQTLPPNQPDQVGPSGPDVTNPPPSTETGPDSLVEAVQDELVKRGYYASKADGMYGDATREALRRFQADRKLAVTGRINEATLHALQLD